jgi:phage tail tape-measure protein
MAQLAVAGGGAALGAALGYVVPGVGTLLGAQVGWALGGVAGALLFLKRYDDEIVVVK